MPFRKTYQINNREQSKAVQRDQSYKNCLITLLIVFFICLILIIACIHWKTHNEKEHKDAYIKYDAQHRHDESRKEITTKSIFLTNPTNTSTQSTSTGNIIDVGIEDYLKNNVKGAHPFERYSKNKTTDDVISTSTKIFEEDDEKYSVITETTQFTETKENNDVTTEEDIKLTTLPFSNVTTNIIDNDTMLTSPVTTINVISRMTTLTSNEENTSDEYFLESYNIENWQVNVTTDNITTLMIPDYLSNLEESTTVKADNANYSEKFDTADNMTISSIQSNFIEGRNTKTTYLKYEELTSAENNTTVITSTEQTQTTEEYDENTISTTIITPTSIDEIVLTSADTFNGNNNICETGYCKQIASKMLSYMNHSADPCDDFYEYACGGFEANPQLINRDEVLKYRNYQRIAKQMLKEKRKNVHSTFGIYYDSCMQYKQITNFTERIKMANDALKKIGQFYTNTTWIGNDINFTDLFVQLMLHHSALLFDVLPELDEYRSNSFTLKIGPSTYENPFKTEYTEDPCFEEDFEINGQYINLEVLYDNYKRCKNDTREFVKSIKEALLMLNVFKDLNDSYLEKNIESEYIESTVHVIVSIIMKEYFSGFPSNSEIREAYLLNNYSKISIEELQSNSAFLNWTQLIYTLTGVNVETSEGVQVYFDAALINGLRKLEKFSKQDAMGLNNAIMGLYAHKLYHELVLSRRNNMKDHCLQAAIYLLPLEASSLYILSYSDQEITYMNESIEKLFIQLKKTLKLKTKEIQWAKEEGLQGLLKKIDSLELAVPTVSYFKNRQSLYSEYNVSEVILNNNYFNNSMTLLRRYRTLMYDELRREVGDLKQIWTFYATPFQSEARTIYGLNLVVIPYGITDWSLINNNLSLEYLLLATLGNLIAHQIAHHFDANGIHYWNQTKNTQDSLMYEDEFTDTNFDDYINCQKKNLYEGSINITLPITDQIVSFTIPQLTLNERLSEIMGLRLAYDTLARVISDAEKRLPWIKLRIDQLFYLAYAQMYCTKLPLTSSYISLYESENLPSRIRIFVSASNNKLLAEAWNCPIGSQVAPNDICSVFPYIDFKEIIVTSQ